MGQMAVQHMSLTYLCRDAIGGLAQYQFARRMAVERAVEAGVKRDDALLMFDDIDAKIRKESGEQIADSGFCIDEINEITHKLEVLSARLRKAR